MKNKFALVLDRYDGITKKAADMLAGDIAAFLGYDVLPVLTYDKMPESMLTERTVIAVGNVNSHPILKKMLGVWSYKRSKEGGGVFDFRRQKSACRG